MHAAIVCAWLAAFFAARLLEYAPHASLWFPPAGITMAALLVLGWRALPALVVACVLATVAADFGYRGELVLLESLATGTAFAVAHIGAFGVAAYLLHSMARSRVRHDATLRSMAAFLLLGAVGAVLAALLGAWSLVLTGVLAADRVGVTLVPWAIGDYAGVVALAPLTILLLGRLAAWARAPVRDGLPRPGGEVALRLGGSFLAKLALLLGTTAMVLFSQSAFADQPAIVYLLFVPVVVQLWIVYTEGAFQAAVAVAAFSVALAALSAALMLGEHALLLQFVLISLAANSWFGLGVPGLYADNQRLRQLLTHDPLTGALSRAFFEDRVREGMQAAQQRGEDAVLLMIDLDRLKIVNDTWGHAAGDAALRALADRCRSSLRPWDLFGRLGGDEFAAFLPGATDVDAQALLRRVRAAIAGTLVPGTDETLCASFGAAGMRQGEDYAALLSRADAAMYAQKRGERDGEA